MKKYAQLTVMTAFSASLFASTGSYAETANVAKGKLIAEQFCAACHMRPGGPINLPGKPPVPAFKDVAAKDGFSAGTVSSILSNPKHPYRLKKLSAAEEADVAAFIATLK